MKVSMNWLSQMVDLKNIGAQELADTLTLAGIEVETVEPLASASHCVVGYVEACEKHPQSDHLSLTKVNIGTKTLSIVCGAPNVAQGQKVIVAQVGAVLPEITIKEASIKGEKSEGMICSLSELGVDPKHLSEEQRSGIEVLDPEAPLGVEALHYLGLDDVILDIKPTPNRSDIQALWALALEVGALLNRNVNLPWEKDVHVQGTKSQLKAHSKTQKCPLILGKKIGSVTVKESPKWMRDALHAVGMKSINNVVDISNIVMLETGQPLHFYDAAKLPHLEICVEDHVNESFETLDGTVIQPHPDDLIITSGSKPIGLAGIMGGDDSKIDETTHGIVIEAAQFNPSSIRHSSRRVNLMTEASLRFQKGLDPHSAFKAMDRAVSLLKDYAEAKDLEETQIYGKPSDQEKKVQVTHHHIELLIGQSIGLSVVMDIYTRLGFKPLESNGLIVCTIPSYRLDIDVAEDLIEEVGRIVGYAQLPGTLPVLPATAGGYTTKQSQRNHIRKMMVGFGLHEVITYTLVNESKTLQGVKPLENPAMLISPISEERRYVRNSLLPSVLESVAYNQAHKMKDFGVFEISNLNTLNTTQERLAMVLSGSKTTSLWQKLTQAYDFYALKGMIERMLIEVGFPSVRISYDALSDHPFFHPLRSVSIHVDKTWIGCMGEIHPKYAKDVDVSMVYMAELNLDALYRLKSSKIKFNPIIKYPLVVRDLAFVLDKDVSAADVEKTIRTVGKQLVKSIEIFDLYEGESLGQDKKSIALKISYQANDHTLTDEEITRLHQASVEACEKQLKAILRSA